MKGIAKIKRTDGQYEKINLCGYKQAEESAANAPVNVDLPINRDSTLCGAPPEVIKKIPGGANQTATVCGFDHAADFIVDGASADQTKYFTVDGKLKPNTVYNVAMSDPSALEDGFMCESEEIDFSQYKIVTGIEVK